MNFRKAISPATAVRNWRRQSSLTKALKRSGRAVVFACVAICPIILASPAMALGTPPFDFPDFVSERNLDPAGLGSPLRFSEGGDAVNLFNGALSYSIPLGGTYPVGGFLSYQLRLVYSSNIWDFTVAGGTVAARPSWRSNAGTGWSLSFGELLAPSTAENSTNFWVYVDPDGAKTRFYAEFEDGAGSVAGVFYSRNGTYRRLKIDGDEAVLESPDGNTTSFRQLSAVWRLTSLGDPFGNTMTIDYSKPDLWVISDTHGREHRIFMRPDPSGAYGQVIDRVELASFAGTTSTYQLTYAVGAVTRPWQDEDPATPDSLSVPLLSKVQPPLGNPYVFSYHAPTGASDDVSCGRLYQVRLPTLGKIRYWYEEVRLPYLAGALHAADVVGVWRRRTFGLDGGLVGTWRLSQSLDIPRVEGSPDQPRELTRTLLYPDGTSRGHRYSVYVTGNADNDQTPPAIAFDRSEYGLPFTKNGFRARDEDFLSWELFAADGSKLSSTFLKYELASCQGCFDHRPRVPRSRAVNHDQETGNDWAVTTTRSDFDGLGHYRTMTTSDGGTGIFSAGTAPAKTVVVDYSGNLPKPNEPWVLGFHNARTTSQGGESETVESCQDPQSGQLLRRRILAGANRGAYDLLRTYEYDPIGNLAVTRYYGGDTQPLGTQYPDLCSLSLPAQAQYASFKEYQNGTSSRSGWLAADGSVYLVTSEAVIDRNTGRVVSSDSGSGLWTSFTYDALGRLIASNPPVGHSGAMTNVYTPADLATAAPEETYSRSDDAGGSVIGEARSVSDGLGRVTIGSSHTVNGWVDLATEYDAMGRVLSMTAPDGSVVRNLDYDAFGRPRAIERPGGPTYTQTFEYGPRSTSETVLVGKSWNEATDTVELIARTSTSVLDRHGRTVQRRVDDADGDFRFEQYAHNMDGRVVETTMTDGIRTSSWTTEDRTDNRGFLTEDSNGDPIFGYDALGHLTLEETVNGAIFNVFDRAGRLTQRREGSATGRLWLLRTYAASNAPGDYRRGKLWKALRRNYDVPHVPDGRVDVEETHHYRGDGGRLSEVTTRVTAGASAALELFTFSTTQSYDGAGQVTDLLYPDCVPDPGNVTADCTPLPTRHLNYAYDFGALTSLTGTLGSSQPESWIASVSYDLSGISIQRVLGNGTIETRTPHASGGGRIAEMTILHPVHGTFYSSGLAEYDGNGKLVKLGTQRRVSDNAYSLEIPDVLQPTGNPSPSPPAVYGDLLGQSPGRSYRVPSRNATFSSDGHEDVWEVHVYGPRGRLWTRHFNDFDAWNYNHSKDEWYLADPAGRRVRTRIGYTHYQGIHQVTHANAALQEVQIFGSLDADGDSIFVGSALLAKTDDLHSSPRRKFYHREIRGHTFATSDPQGRVEINRAPLQ